MEAPEYWPWMYSNAGMCTTFQTISAHPSLWKSLHLVFFPSCYYSMEREWLDCSSVPCRVEPAPCCGKSWSRALQRSPPQLPVWAAHPSLQYACSPGDPRSAHVPAVYFTGQRPSTQKSRIIKLDVAGGPEAESPEWPEEYSITGLQAAALIWTWTIMHVLFWGLGFLLFPDFLNVVASTGRLFLNSSKGKVCRSVRLRIFFTAVRYFLTGRVQNEWIFPGSARHMTWNAF